MSLCDFIPNFSEYLHDHYPMLPQLWTDLLSANTLSATIHKDTFFHNKYGNNRCNTWIALFAPSGDFKSAPIDNIICPMLNYVGAKTERYFILPSIASTVEGIIKYFRQQKDENCRGGLIVRDELTTFFKESLYKDYLTDEMEIYSKMYDGVIYPRETMQFSSRKVMDVNVSLVGATTPKYLYDVLTLKFFFQGCGNRFCYVHHKVPPKTNYKEGELFDNEPPKWTEDKKITNELLPLCDVLIKAAEKPYTIITSDLEVERLSAEFRNRREEIKFKIPEDSEMSFKREYISRDWQKSLKYAQLRAFSRDFLKPAFRKAKTVMILPEDIEWGQKIVEECFQHFEMIIDEWSKNIRMEKPKTVINRNLELLMIKIVKAYRVVSQNKLAYEVGETSRGVKFFGSVNALLDAGCIKKMENGDYVRLKGMEWMQEMMINSNFDRPPVLYEFVKDLPKETFT